MQKTNLTEKKAPVLKFVLILAVATSVILVFTVTPWNLVPTLVTENVTVIAVTEHGCVAESILEHPVVVSNCDANPGDVISATFYIPAMELNGYYDRVQEKLSMVNP
ncbi:MAG: hypothetical protein ACE5R5_07490 [Nitrosarchaeum sp.]